jgi:hypothetical protein
MIDPRLCPTTFVVDSSAGVKITLDPGPSLKKKQYSKKKAACS